MITVAVICEYNPFHKGHEYQFRKIREEFGEDTAIVAIMSGNYTQRGDVSFLDKGARAKCAVLGGVNLVLELPFPFSMLSAEYFASSAVSIIDDLGCVDYLSFGSEDGNINAILKAAELMQTDKFTAELNNLINQKEYENQGYPRLLDIALQKLTVDGTSPIKLTPNNILGIEYVKALKRIKSDVTPHTIQRVANSYNDAKIVEGSIQSASAIRSSLSKGDISAYNYMPLFANSIIEHEKAAGEFPCDISRISAAIISNFRINTPDAYNKICDANGGLYNRLKEKSFEANDINAMLCLCETKTYTKSRLRRAMLTSFFGVTSSEAKNRPEYTQVLAMDSVGQAKLKQIKKNGRISVLTKPSNVKGLSEVALSQKMRSDMADSIFEMTKPSQPDGKRFLRFTPYVKK